MKLGDKGAAVKDLQLKLLALGYSLPRWGADGDFGKETEKALKEYAKDNGLSWCVDTVVDHVLKADLPELEIIDLRDLQKDPPEVTATKKKHKIRNGKVVRRDMKDVDGIVLHQTAVWYGVSKNQIRNADGDKHEALHRRGLRVACHAIAFGGEKAGIDDCGHAIATNPLEWYVYHGNGLNDRSLGLEIEGKYPGLIGSKGDVASDKIIKAACDALKYLVEEGRRQGAPIKYLWAHRQSSSTRRADPGEELWKKVGLEYGVKVLGLETQPHKTWGKGRPIPLEWDPDGKGNY